jgi:hypothetical protein
METFGVIGLIISRGVEENHSVPRLATQPDLHSTLIAACIDGLDIETLHE